MGEKGNFRGRLFGGFDRQDVINYIESVSQKRGDCERQRDTALEELEAANERIVELESERADLRDEIEQLKQQLSFEQERTVAYKEEKLQEAAAAIDELISLCARMKADIAVNISNAQCEVKRLDAGLAAISGVFSQAEEKLTTLRQDIENL